ncbi:uncharacterized protein LOC120399517 isoform X7 [Mauremys reevesii]|uniref:uncharacterized protein LOC120399517 isoform X7 n=1 Tax=Mauremys reevesii TaxID=260615 RepID=UPI00193FF846|nr:uncharacterized protein LOC120399517 isoform X7 [Mauremys reevesii]
MLLKISDQRHLDAPSPEVAHPRGDTSRSTSVTAQAGSPCFLDKTHLIKKGAARLKRDNIDRTHDSVAFYETGGVASIPDAPQISDQILGIEGSTVPVYVLITSKDLILKCLTQKLLKQRIIDPKYQWIGPIGLITKESQRFVLTDDGSLEIYNIHGSDSGSYICNVIYVHNNKYVTTEIRFMVYVTCPPGRFSARYDTTCILCASGSYNKKYGQTACKNCPKTQTSDRRGAKTERECHGTLQIWIIFLISSLGTSLILVTAWAIIHKCCRRTLAARYIEEAESELKTRLKTFANIASDAEIEEQRSKLRNPDRYERKNLPKYKVGFIEEESIGLLSNDGITETSTPVGSNPSPDRTWPSEVETSFEEGRSQGTLEEEIHCVSKGLVSNPQKFNTNHKLS